MVRYDNELTTRRGFFEAMVLALLALFGLGCVARGRATVRTRPAPRHRVRVRARPAPRRRGRVRVRGQGRGRGRRRGVRRGHRR